METMVTQGEMSHQFFVVLFRRKWVIIATFLVILGGVCAYTYIEYPLYKGTAKILVHRNPKQQLILFRDMVTPAQPDIRISPAKNLIEISRSQGIGQRVVSQFGLDARLTKRSQSPEATRDIIWYWINAFLDIPIRLGELVGLLPESKPNYQQRAIEQLLESRLDITLISETELVNLSIWEESPHLASSITNTLALLLIEKTINMNQLKASTAYVFTREQVENAAEELDRMEQLLANFKSREQLVALAREKQLKLDRLDALQGEHDAIAADEDRLRARLAEVQKELLSAPPEILASTVTAHNPLITELKSSLYRAETESASRQSEMRKSHPEIAGLQARIEKNTQQVKAEKEKIVQSETTILNPLHQDLTAQVVKLQAEIEGFSAKRQALREQLAALKEELLALPEKEVMLNKLDRQVKTQEALFLNLKNKLEELEVQQVNRLSEFDITVVDEAYLPDDASPDWPDWELNLLIGIPSGLLLALLLAFFVDYWDESYTSYQRLARDIEIPVLGSVPESRNHKNNHKNRI